LKIAIDNPYINSVCPSNTRNTQSVVVMNNIIPVRLTEGMLYIGPKMFSWEYKDNLFIRSNF